MQETAIPYRGDIQILRGIAVVLVVFFHLNVPLFAHGFLGVDAFFVISGFLMAILYRPGFPLTFYRRRAARLLPAYFVTVLATVVASTFLVLPSEHAQTVQQGLFASVFASNFGFWAQNSYFSKTEFNPLLHFWSLGVEIQFYLIMPLLAWLYGHSRAALALLAAGSVAATLVLLQVSPKTAFFMMPFRIWQFLAGAGVAWLLTNGGAVQTQRPRIGLLCLAGLSGVAMIYRVDGQATNVMTGHPGLAAILVTAATAGVLACGLPVALVESWPGRILRKTGDWSYAIYLAHFPVIVLGLYQPFSGTILTATTWLQVMGLVAGIAAFGLVLYFWFDHNKMWSHSFTLRRLVISIAFIAMVSLASAPVARLGYKATDLNILAAFTDRSTYRCGKLFRVLNPRGQLCELTHDLPDSAPVMILLGDSHADSIKTSFTQVAQAKGVRLFFSVSNTPIIDEPQTPALIQQAKAIGAKAFILHFSSGNAIRAFDAGFHAKATAEGISIAWMLPVPVYDQSVPEMIWAQRNAEPPFIGAPVNYAVIDELQSRLDGVGLQAFDPRPVLCPAVCTLADEQAHPYYFDDGHLTLTGARRLEGLMAATLASFDQPITE